MKLVTKCVSRSLPSQSLTGSEVEQMLVWPIPGPKHRCEVSAPLGVGSGTEASPLVCQGASF